MRCRITVRRSFQQNEKIDILINQAILSIQDLVNDVHLEQDDPLYQSLDIVYKNASAFSKYVAPGGRIITLLSRVANK